MTSNNLGNVTKLKEDGLIKYIDLADTSLILTPGDCILHVLSQFVKENPKTTKLEFYSKNRELYHLSTPVEHLISLDMFYVVVNETDNTAVLNFEEDSFFEPELIGIQDSLISGTLQKFGTSKRKRDILAGFITQSIASITKADQKELNLSVIKQIFEYKILSDSHKINR